MFVRQQRASQSPWLMARGEDGACATSRYDVVVGGHLGETILGAFAGLEVQTRCGEAVLTGDLDQAALHGVLRLIGSLRLEPVAQ